MEETSKKASSSSDWESLDQAQLRYKSKPIAAKVTWGEALVAQEWRMCARQTGCVLLGFFINFNLGCVWFWFSSCFLTLKNTNLFWIHLRWEGDNPHQKGKWGFRVAWMSRVSSWERMGKTHGPGEARKGHLRHVERRWSRKQSAGHWKVPFCFWF